MASQIHLISKADLQKHEVVGYTTPKKPLSASTVRVNTKVVGLTSNNFTYASLGSIYGWWNVYPVPSDVPAPYKATEWGIVPAWGRAEISESNIDALPVGMSLWGLWPTSGHAVDLQLKPHQLKGHWTEISEARASQMTVYNHYTQMPKEYSDTEHAIDYGFYPVGQAGYCISSFVFPSHGEKPFHPFGPGAWSAEDADISKALIVNLSASSKTGRSLAWQLLRNRGSENAPLGLLQVSSNPAQLQSKYDSKIKHKAVSYTDLLSEETLEWIDAISPAKISVIDCGAPGERVVPYIQSLRNLPSKPVVQFMGVGVQAKVMDPEQMQQGVALFDTLGRIQMNTSTLRDAAIEVHGPKKVIAGWNESYARCVKEGGFGDVETEWREGVNSISDVWTDLSGGSFVSSKKFTAVRL